MSSKRASKISDLIQRQIQKGSSLDGGNVKQIQYGIENSSLVEPQVCGDFSQKERMDQ
ncbi:MAG: hypothetical protein JOZ08_10100 [Verrucomicrobia bacterium]|nr:hypothetical protein [Verrucomicrobiota bacterium]MBV8276809.1 hypothetical protein [Verrucomicrobiota bacterium]